jgi:DNA invertase Pin-like site-specific DNA recombinase
VTKPIHQAEKRAVLYSRVSSKEQEKEGFSIPAQQKLLERYAIDKGFHIHARYTDVETAKRAGRLGFAEMVALLRSNQQCRIVIVEKTDRLYRNFKDYVTLDEIEGLEIHFAKEGTVISRDSRSSEKLIHGIKVLMAKNYIDNLSEETRKGMLEKAEQGIFPSYAPIGYKNADGPNGKRIIVLDETQAPMYRRLFELCSTARYSIKDLGALVREERLTGRSDRPLPTSTVHKILRSRFYCGEFDWAGKTYQGTHEPIVSKELWQQVQLALDGRLGNRAKKRHHAFPFSGLLTCGHCGYALVGEIKKGKYVYYRCRALRGTCTLAYVPQEEIERDFERVLRTIVIDEEVAGWVAIALRQSHADQMRFREAEIKKLNAEHERIQKALDTLYDDRIERRIDLAFFERKSQQWRDEQSAIRWDIERHQTATESFMDAGVRIIELSQKLHSMFLKQPAHEKRRLLDFVVSNCSWKDGRLTPTFRQPFDMLALAVTKNLPSATLSEVPSTKNEKWLPAMDSNHDSQYACSLREGF